MNSAPPPPGPIYWRPPGREKRWWERKWVIMAIPSAAVAMFVGLVVLVAAVEPPADETLSQGGRTFADPAVSTEVPLVTVAVTPAQVGNTTTTEITTTVATVVSDERIHELAFALFAREITPGLALLDEQQLLDLGYASCEAAARVETVESLSLVITLAWTGYTDDVKAMFGGDPANVASLSGAAVGSLCEVEGIRLGVVEAW